MVHDHIGTTVFVRHLIAARSLGKNQRKKVRRRTGNQEMGGLLDFALFLNTAEILKFFPVRDEEWAQLRETFALDSTRNIVKKPGNTTGTS